MKRFLCVAMLTAAAFAVSAEANDARRGAVSIPFDFKVQGQQMPAGQYRITSQGTNFVVLQNLTTGKAVHVMRQGSAESGARRLYFRQVGTERILKNVG